MVISLEEKERILNLIKKAIPAGNLDTQIDEFEKRRDDNIKALHEYDLIIKGHIESINK